MKSEKEFGVRWETGDGVDGEKSSVRNEGGLYTHYGGSLKEYRERPISGNCHQRWV